MSKFHVGDRVITNQKKFLCPCGKKGTIVEVNIDGFSEKASNKIDAEHLSGLLTVEFDEPIGYHAGRLGKGKPGHCIHISPSYLSHCEVVIYLKDLV